MASALALVVAPLAAQETPLSDFVLAGYGSAGYSAGLDGFSSNFTASVAPVLLYRMGDDLLFEAELEFGVEGTRTETGLEYAQVDYLGFERLQLSFGKFLLPFGVFGERLHPTWINKLPTMPLLYGHSHGGQAEGALLPIMSDLGLMARYNQPLGGLNLDLSLYVTQGPMRVDPDAISPDDDHAHAVRDGDSAGGGAAVGGAAYLIPGVAFGVSLPDNNKNKMVGARVGLVKGPVFEIFVSGFHSMYDPNDYLDMVGGNLSIEHRTAAGELRTEVTFLGQEFSDNGTYRYLVSPGYYVQYAYRFGAFEPVLRWSHLLPGRVGAEDVTAERQELAIGFDYWVQPSIPVKVAYEMVPNREDRLLFQWAFGF
jgi:hypothetical protein